MTDNEFRDEKIVTKRGRPTLRKKGPLTDAERSKRYRAKVKRTRPSAKTLAKQASRAAREVELGLYQRALPDKPHGLIYADPPTRLKSWSRETGMDRAADNHYPTMRDRGSGRP